MENIDKLAEALAKAQGMMTGAKKDETNPFFKANYADLASVWEDIRQPLSENGLSIVQPLGTVNGKTCVITYLLHKSGQFMKSILTVNPPKPDMQSLGAAISYARRYSLCAMVGVYQVDLDADKDQKKKDDEKKKPATTRKSQTEQEKDAPSRSILPNQDDIPYGIVPSKITSSEATAVRKKCSALHIPPKVAKSMIKDLGIPTIDEIPADRYQEIIDALGFLHSEMSGANHD